ncbi:MAG: lysylphosphatidylglycerol synthase transmembrane domain-containing protein [Candidatus Nanoarchaeia archaeon]|nr:lysylphosphatidylglycerol synthase transmembrane domain-containing protein [Candidatus Nanoarchaeia archaeon]
MKLRRLLPLIGVVIFIYIIYNIGLDKILQASLLVNFKYLLLGTFLMCFLFLFQFFKWNSILKSQGTNLEPSYIYWVNVVSQYYGVITPGKIGSLAKAFYLQSKLKTSLAKASSSVMIDRILDLLVVAIMGGAGILILADAFLLDFNKTLFFLVLMIIGCITFLNEKVTRFFLGFFYDWFVPKRYKETLRNNFYSFYNNFPKWYNLIIPTILTIVTWLYVYFISYIFALAYSIQIPIIPFLMISAIGTIIALIPITFSGLGTREAFLIFALGFYGVAAEKIVLMSVSGTIALTLVCMLFGLYALYVKGIRINS